MFLLHMSNKMGKVSMICKIWKEPIMKLWKYNLSICVKKLRKSKKNSVSMAHNLAGIQNRYVLNTYLRHSLYTKVFGHWKNQVTETV